ncbi:MAG TPA: FAD-dependent oxidoreductase [Syntrophorhabdaceae bacterium]|nr:FAD-dependent oxidoreductase [Syntrophorhabdaceae bacterium]
MRHIYKDKTGDHYRKLFEPINIGKITLKNRIAMAPMGLLGLTDREGNPSPRAIDYYMERARGGVGLIITGLFKVENKIDVSRPYMTLISHSSLGPLGELGEAVHALGAKIFIQLTAGFGRVSRTPTAFGQPVSASAVAHYSDPSVTCRSLSTEEVEIIVRAFGDAAETVATAGMDGIELHGHEGYLLDQFTTALWNQRVDRYGGSLKARLTFPIEIVQEIKKRIGNEFPVVYRFGLKHFIKGPNRSAFKGEDFVEQGRDLDEGVKMARLLQGSGFDALHVDAGSYDSWYWAHPPIYQEHGCMIEMAASAKQAVSIPVIAVGRLESPDVAEQTLASGKADIIALGRGLLAEPRWPMIVRENRNEDLRPCIGCHDGCMGRFSTFRPLCCTVNPAVGREREYQLTPANTQKKVVVVGGGMAGMEAARAAAIRGHSITLYEKSERLGGHVIEAAVPEFKKDLKRLIEWYETQLKKLDIEIRLGIEATEQDVLEHNPDAALVATGSDHVMPDLPGIENRQVVTCTELLAGRSTAHGAVVVIGGGLMGCETALWLAQQGLNVSVVEMLPELMPDVLHAIPRMNRIMLLDLMTAHGVKTITGAEVQEIACNSVMIARASFEKNEVPAQTVVIATGMQPRDGLYRALNNKIAHLYALGDCREPRNITGAIWDGYEVGRTI